jgi:SpoVK/Ycf46/Vps4 family AAA+-type ATPase
MIRTAIEDAAISAAKANSHAEVEPRHVHFALARRFRERPDCAAYFALARSALEPAGNSLAAPVMSEAAKTLLDTIKTDDDGVAVLQGAFKATGDGQSGAAATQTKEDSDQATKAAESAAEAKGAEATADVLAELDALTGLASVKAQVRRIIAVVQANTEREKAGLKPVNPGLHLVFTGPPGTGKTTVARLIARLYASTGALKGSKFNEATRSDLGAGYVGQTAIKTTELINKSRPGVLFIDEAYALTPSYESDFGHEAIATLVKAMEDHRDELAVIVAGYEDEMTEFIGSNPGLRSRFKTRIGFPDYSADELIEIFDRMLVDVGIGLSEEARAKAKQIFARTAGKRDFGNARFARSLFENAYAHMAARAAVDGVLTVDELGLQLPEDIQDDHSTPATERRIGFGA